MEECVVCAPRAGHRDPGLPTGLDFDVPPVPAKATRRGVIFLLGARGTVHVLHVHACSATRHREQANRNPFSVCYYTFC